MVLVEPRLVVPVELVVPVQSMLSHSDGREICLTKQL